MAISPQQLYIFLRCIASSAARVSIALTY